MKGHTWKIYPSPYTANVRLDGGYWRPAALIWGEITGQWKTLMQVWRGIGGDEVYSYTTVRVVLWVMRREGIIESGWGRKPNGTPIRFYRRKTWANQPELPWERVVKEFDERLAQAAAGNGRQTKPSTGIFQKGHHYGRGRRSPRNRAAAGSEGSADGAQRGAVD